MFKYLYTLLIIAFVSFPALAAEQVKGYVYDDKKEPVIGANVYWEGTRKGTTTDINGHFEIETTEETDILVVSFIGHNPVTTTVTHPEEYLEIMLTASMELDDVVVTERKMGTITFPDNRITNPADHL